MGVILIALSSAGIQGMPHSSTMSYSSVLGADNLWVMLLLMCEKEHNGVPGYCKKDLFISSQTYCQQLECSHSTLPFFASGVLDFRFQDYFWLVARCIAHAWAWHTYPMSWAHIIESKWQRGVGTFELLAIWLTEKKTKAEVVVSHDSIKKHIRVWQRNVVPDVSPEELGITN